MTGNEVSDYKQLKEVKKRLALNLEKKLILKSLYYCGSKVPVIRGQAAVALVANNKQAKFVGVSSCKSSWCCPVCTSRQMAKHGARIACAIEALKKQGLVPAMLTFTVPHTSGFTCEQVTEIAYKTWKAFTVHGNKPAGNYMNDVFANFCGSFNSKHRVRVTEYTFGNAGWHPHFHCLFWFPANRIQEILEWEGRLNERWLELCKRFTIRELLIGYPETQRKTVLAKVTTRVNIMYAKMDRCGSNGVYISKDKAGKVIVQKSSQYITGWSADKELTGNVKNKARENHYTWQQILELAIQTNDEKWWNLYFEYALATRKYRHARVNFSVQSGIGKIIENYKKTESYKTFSKKNATDRLKNLGRWKTVCWFTKLQWKLICLNDLEADLLQLALNENALQQIINLLESHKIPIPVQNAAQSVALENVLNAA